MRSTIALWVSLAIFLTLLQYGRTTAELPVGEYKDWRSHAQLVNSTDWRRSTTRVEVNMDLCAVLDFAVNRYLKTELPIMVGTGVDEWVAKVTPVHMVDVAKHRRRIRKKSRKTSPPLWPQKSILQLLFASLYLYYTRDTQAKRLYRGFMQFLHSVPVATLPMSAGYSALVREMLLMIAGDVERNPGPTSLTVANLRDVLRAVYSARAKWRFIGLELGLSPDDLDNIRKELQDNDERLENVLTKWLRQPNLNPSWESLAECLRSEVVGRREDLATEIVSKWCSTSDESPSQQEDNVIFPAQSAPSPSYNALQEYISYLRAVYACSEFPMYGKWPLTQSICYIALASIEKKKTENAIDEIRDATIHGDIDRVFIKRSPITMNEILATEPSSGKRPRCVLVEGGPGVGKTTFGWEVCKKWGQGELFHEYEMAVFLQLRMSRVQNATKIADLFCCHDEQQQKHVDSHVKKTHGKGVLLILDGLDELPEKRLSEDSMFGQLLSGTVLPNANILVTSRPSVIGKLLSTWQKKVTRHVEILGFTKQSINDYTESVMPSDALPDFRKYLSAHPHIHTMMYVPLNSAIVVEVYNHSQQSNRPTPTTATQLYNDFSLTVLQRYLRSHPAYKYQDWNLTKFSDLPDLVCTCFQKLCEVAHNGTVAQQLQVTFKDLGSSFDHLGFMHSSSDIFSPRGVSTSYSFLHLSIQEYLAAVHMSQLCRQQQAQLCCDAMDKSYRNDFHLRNVYKYFFGVTQLKDCDLSGLEHVTSSGFSPTTVTIELLYEAQNPDLLSGLGQSTNNEVKVELSLTPTNCVALVYCIAHSKCLWNLTISITDDHRAYGDIAEEFASELSHHGPSCADRICGLTWTGDFSGVARSTTNLTTMISIMNSLKVLVLRLLTLPMEAIEAIFNKLPTCNKICVDYRVEVSTAETSSGFNLWYEKGQHLDVVMPPECAVLLSESICTSSLRHSLPVLTVKTSTLDSESVKAFAAILGATESLTMLDIESNEVMLAAAQDLARGIRQNKTLDKFHVQGLVDVEGAIAISEAAGDHETLQQLRITNKTFVLQSLGDKQTLIVTMPPECAVLLSKSICTSSLRHSLTTLTVKTSILDSESAKAFTAILEETESLTMIDITSKGLKLAAARELARGIRQNKTLDKFHVQGSVEVEGAIAISEAVGDHDTLQQLHIASKTFVLQSPGELQLYANVPSDNIVILPQELCTKRYVKVLNISRNQLDLASAEMFSTMLQSNRSLTVMDVSYSSIGDGEAKHLAAGLHSNQALRELYMSHNSIGDEGAIALACSLQYNTTLKCLDVTHNCIGSEGGLAVAKSFAQIETRSYLSISLTLSRGHMNCTLAQSHSHYSLTGICMPQNETVILPEHIAQLTKVLCTDNLIKELQLGDWCEQYMCRPGEWYTIHRCRPRLDQQSAQIFAETLKGTSRLTKVSICCEIGDSEVQQLANGLRCNTSVQELEIDSQTIGDAGVAAIADSLHDNQTLQKLCIWGALYSGIIALAEAFPCNTVLQCLEILADILDLHVEMSHTRLTVRRSGEDMDVVRQILKVNPSIQEMEVSTFLINTETTAQAFATFFTQNQTLEKLNVQIFCGHYADKVVHHLAEGLSCNTRLQEINLTTPTHQCEPWIRERATTDMVKLVHHNKVARVLNLSGVTIEASGALTMVESFNQSPTLQELVFNVVLDHGCVFNICLNKSLSSLTIRQNYGGQAISIAIDVIRKNPWAKKLSLSAAVGCLSEEFVTLLQTNHLTHLDINDCEIDLKCLTEGLQHCTALQQLNLSGSRSLNVTEWDHLFTATLTNLSVAGCDIKDDSVCHMAKAMSHSVKLKQLNVSHNRVGDEGAIAIAEALHHNASLRLLDLSMNNIGLNGATALTEAYRQSETLQQLNIGTRIDQALQLDLKIADATITAVQNWQFVTTTAQILTNELLDLITNTVAILSANELKISTLWFTPESAGALSTLLKENQTLTQIRLTSCKPDRIPIYLAEHKCRLMSNQHLNEVRLKGRNIVGERILHQLLDGVNHSKTLKTLDMSRTKFSSGSPQAVPLIHHPVFLSMQLTPFEIEYFSIGDAGARLLADGLKCNTTLEELNISRNDIGDTGALAMANLLTHNCTLRHLDLSFNSIEDRGASAIAMSLGRNKALQELDLSENLIQDSGASSMAEMLKTNTTIRQLHMYTSKLSFSIGLEGTTALVDSLEFNQHLLRLTLPDKFHEYLQSLPTYREHKHRIEHNCQT